MLFHLFFQVLYIPNNLLEVTLQVSKFPPSPFLKLVNRRLKHLNHYVALDSTTRTNAPPRLIEK